MKKFIMLMITLLLISNMAACTGNDEKQNTPEDTKGSAEETLIIGIPGEPAGLDMCQNQDGVSGMAYPQLFDTLLFFDYDDLEIKPSLAESWEMIDDRTIRFHLRDDVYFHNGDKLKASDVLFTIRHGKTMPAKRYLWDPFDDVNSKVVDDLTVDICTYEPFAPMLTYLSDTGTSVMSERGFEELGADAFNRSPVGTGAFKVKEWASGEYLLLERHDQYWNGTPYYKYMKFLFMPDSVSRTLALQTGSIDICPDPVLTSLQQLKDEGFGIATCNDMISTNIVFNCQDPILSNKLVRKAMQYALDIKTIGDIAFDNTGRPADSFFPFYIPGRIDATGDLAYTQDVEKAKRLLAEAGYPDGFDVEVWTNENQNRMSICEMIQNAWGKIGINAHTKIMEHPAMIEAYSKGEHQIVVNGYSAGAPDGDFLHDKFYSTIDYARNYCGYRNPEWDKIMDEARVLVNDMEARKELYSKAIDILREDLPSISVRYSEMQIGHRGDLTGVRANPNRSPKYWWVKPAD